MLKHKYLQQGHMVGELAAALGVFAAVACLVVWGPSIWRAVPVGAWVLMAIPAVLAGAAAWLSRPRPTRGDGVPCVLDVEKAGPHPVRRATLLAPLALLLPRPARAFAPGADPFDLADLRAAARAEDVRWALGRLSQERPWQEHCPWQDVPLFDVRLRYALRRGATAEQALAHAAGPKDWVRILGRMVPGADPLAAAQEALERQLDDAHLLEERRMMAPKPARTWATPERQAKVAAVVAVLRQGVAS